MLLYNRIIQSNLRSFRFSFFDVIYKKNFIYLWSKILTEQNSNIIIWLNNQKYCYKKVKIFNIKRFSYTQDNIFNTHHLLSWKVLTLYFLEIIFYFFFLKSIFYDTIQIYMYQNYFNIFYLTYVKLVPTIDV